jgi:hypothetical protein
MLQGGTLIVEAMLQNQSIHAIRAEGNVFHIRFIDKLLSYCERNLRMRKDQIMPGLLKDRRKLSMVASSKAIFQIIA